MDKIKAIKQLIKQTRKDLQECCENDSEYTIGGNGVNFSEADAFFRGFSKQLETILNAKD